MRVDERNKFDLPERKYLQRKIKQCILGIVLLLLYGACFFFRLSMCWQEQQILEEDVGQICEIEGNIIWQKENPRGYEYYLKAETIRLSNRIINTYLKFQFYSQKEIQLHSKIKVTGKLALFDMPKNPGDWNKNYYYKGKNIYYQIKKAKPEILEIGMPNTIDQFKIWVLNQTAKYMPETERGLFLSLFTGNKSELEKKLADSFRKVGVSHILAVSGLHVALLVWMFSTILKKLPLTYSEQYLILLIILIFYLCFTGGQASTLRAVMMFAILESSYFWKTEKNPKQAYLLTLAILLLINPFSIYDIGFVLSFSTMGALLYVYPLLFENCPKYLQGIGATVTVQIVLLPIFSLVFHRFSLTAVVANLWVVPAISFFLGISGIALGISGLSVTMAQVLTGSGYYMAKSAIWLAEKLSGLAWSELPIRAMNIGEIFLFYAIIIATLVTKQRKLLWGLLFSLVIFIPYSWQPQLAMLDVGQAESMVIEYRNHVMIIDTGLETNNSTVSYLHYRGKNKIDMVLLSHLDKDHAGGLKNLLDHFKIGSIGISASYMQLTNEIAESFALSGTWQSYQELLVLSEKYQVPILYWQAGDKIDISDLHFSFLYPLAEEIPLTANDFSFVAEMEYGKAQILFTGDIGLEAEQVLVSRKVLKDIEVLKVAHHGSKYSSHDKFLEIIKPELAIISCGRYNRYGHPSADLLEKLQKEKIVTKVTAWDGPIFLEFFRKGEVRLNE